MKREAALCWYGGWGLRVSVVKEEIKKPGPNPVPAIKIKPLIEGIGGSRLGLYSGWCGWALARAHAKSSDAAMISGHLGSNGSRSAVVMSIHKKCLTSKERT